MKANIAKAFKAAKQLVSHTYRIGDKEQFICHALERARREGRISTIDCHEAIHIVTGRLRPYGNCVEVFLDAMGVGWQAADRDAVQEYRHLWLDALIEEFSK